MKFGPKKTSTGFAFSAKFPYAKSVYIDFYKPDSTMVFKSLQLEKKAGIWSISIDDLTEDTEYLYRVDDTSYLDPYSLDINTKTTHSKIFTSTFDWNGVTSPNYGLNELIIYEMHVRGFTFDTSSKCSFMGTFKGMIEKIDHLKELGINAVELMPVCVFDRDKNNNYWGYSPLHFFSLMHRYGSIDDFKEMVREFHKHGIEIILDMVFNHTGETPLLEAEGYLANDYTGCGNTVNTNHPIVTELIVNSLVNFREELRIDGFRFDLASVFTRDENGTIVENSPIIKAIGSHPSLKTAKLIAEPWDLEVYQLGKFPKRFAEWNGEFRDVCRSFIRGDSNREEDMLHVMLGSKNIFESNGKKPYQSINFITAHDGFTLHDLVSYNDKHNKKNQEDNRDGNDHNISSNYGFEGETDNEAINELRQRQILNFITVLMISIGTPMMLSSDEYGHTRHGNNNPWCQDNELNWFSWDNLKQNTEIFSFWKKMIAFRKKHEIFQTTEALTRKNYICHTSSDHVLSYSLFCKTHEILIMMNMGSNTTNIPLKSDLSYKTIINTTDIEDEGTVKNQYCLLPHCTVVGISA